LQAVSAVTTLLNSEGGGPSSSVLGEMIPLIYEAGERILDVSASVRKNSFGVFAGVILNDPLLASVSLGLFVLDLIMDIRYLHCFNFLSK